MLVRTEANGSDVLAIFFLGRHALEYPGDCRGDRRVEIDGASHLASVWFAAAPTKTLEKNVPKNLAMGMVELRSKSRQVIMRCAQPTSTAKHGKRDGLGRRSRRMNLKKFSWPVVQVKCA